MYPCTHIHTHTYTMKTAGQVQVKWSSRTEWMWIAPVHQPVMRSLANFLFLLPTLKVKVWFFLSSFVVCLIILDLAGSEKEEVEKENKL